MEKSICAGQKANILNSESKKGTISCSISELHNQISMVSSILMEIEDCIFLPRAQAPCGIEQPTPVNMTLDAELYEIHMRLDGLNSRLCEVKEVLKDKFGSNLKLV